MKETVSFFRGFLSVHFFRHSAGIAVFMLFTLSMMSFRYRDRFADAKSASKADSTSNNSTKAFANLLSNPVANNNAAMREMFKLNSHMQPFLKEYKRKETEEYEGMKVWGKPYLDLMDDILAKNGLPTQLKYLCVIESNLKAGTVSHSGATGPWQLMPDEGRMYGLCMKKGNDDRKDYEKSTEVAAGLLKSLYNQFGDWLLVIAAYNCGNSTMRKAILKAASKNYWVVQNYLPQQARNHVKKYIATHYIFEGGGGWTTITNDEACECKAAIARLEAQNAENDSIFARNAATVEISGKYNSSVLIKSLLIDRELFDRLNPHIDQDLLDGKTYPLKLPANKIPLFQANRKDILEQSVQLLFSSAYNK